MRTSYCTGNPLDRIFLGVSSVRPACKKCFTNEHGASLRHGRLLLNVRGWPSFVNACRPIARSLNWKGMIMTRERKTKYLRSAFAATVALGVASSFATPPAEQESASPSVANVTVAAATTTPATSGELATVYPASQEGVRAAAADSSDALRRYVHRTRAIYGYYYWDFAKRQ
jgi:hypothetical protein